MKFQWQPIIDYDGAPPLNPLFLLAKNQKTKKSMKFWGYIFHLLHFLLATW